MITDDVSKFGHRELAVAAKMFNSAISHGFPDNFEFLNIRLRDGLCDECDGGLECEECGADIDYLDDSY